mmetsp:Transcript_25936/g.42397  ORF Transcript_25936/g.42397 Transcript_25936/m.42397 type:complete len:213 (-) Transcript_25936:1162-1800(-)
MRSTATVAMCAKYVRQQRLHLLQRILLVINGGMMPRHHHRLHMLIIFLMLIVFFLFFRCAMRLHIVRMYVIHMIQIHRQQLLLIFFFFFFILLVIFNIDIAILFFFFSYTGVRRVWRRIPVHMRVDTQILHTFNAPLCASTTMRQCPCRHLHHTRSVLHLLFFLLLILDILFVLFIMLLVLELVFRRVLLIIIMTMTMTMTMVQCCSSVVVL